MSCEDIVEVRARRDVKEVAVAEWLKVSAGGSLNSTPEVLQAKRIWKS
jgi:hypothetical protein